jgi:hypothetical protein
LSNSGKPLNTALFNVHKLIALGAVILAAVQVSVALKGVESPMLAILLLSAVGVCVAALFATGALMSIGKMNYDLLLTVHRIAPVLAAGAMAAAVYALGSKP